MARTPRKSPLRRANLIAQGITQIARAINVCMCKHGVCLSIYKPCVRGVWRRVSKALHRITCGPHRGLCGGVWSHNETSRVVHALAACSSGPRRSHRKPGPSLRVPPRSTTSRAQRTDRVTPEQGIPPLSSRARGPTRTGSSSNIGGPSPRLGSARRSPSLPPPCLWPRRLLATLVGLPRSWLLDASNISACGLGGPVADWLLYARLRARSPPAATPPVRGATRPIVLGPSSSAEPVARKKRQKNQRQQGSPPSPAR